MRTLCGRRGALLQGSPCLPLAVAAAEVDARLALRQRLPVGTPLQVLALATTVEALWFLRLRRRIDAKPDNAENGTSISELLDTLPSMPEVIPLVNLLPIQLDDTVPHLPSKSLGLLVHLHDNDTSVVLVSIIEAEAESPVRECLLDCNDVCWPFFWHFGSPAFFPFRPQQPLHRREAVDVGIAEAIRVIVLLLRRILLVAVLVRLLFQLTSFTQLSLNRQNVHLLLEHLPEWILIRVGPDLTATLYPLLPFCRRTGQGQCLLLIPRLFVLPSLELFKDCVLQIADELGGNVVARFCYRPNKQSEDLLHEGLDPSGVD
mmetsp:Transcript_24373/g.76667  ORF Transcript_24373/g.76667 Transcript_24373/m.76667 type:complete len:318 (-) Transcript_24373:1732-2685(-)